MTDASPYPFEFWLQCERHLQLPRSVLTIERIESMAIRAPPIAQSSTAIPYSEGMPAETSICSVCQRVRSNVAQISDSLANPHKCQPIWS